jgi:hypothetical protein
MLVVCPPCVGSALEAVAQQVRWLVSCRSPEQEPYHKVYNLCSFSHQIWLRSHVQGCKTVPCAT